MKTTRFQFFALGFLVWLLGSLAPYLFVGETWGMVWFVINYPTAVLAKKLDVLEWHYPVLFVAVTTLLNAILVGLVGSVLGSFWRRRGKTESTGEMDRPR